jgi:hypothetical protein
MGRISFLNEKKSEHNTDNCNYILMLKLSILPFSHLTSPSEIESAKAGVEII